jgi:hypothetical protein
MGLIQPGRKPDRSSTSSAEVKNAWSYTPNPPHFFMTWYLLRRKDRVTLTSTLKRKEIGRHKLKGVKKEQEVLGRTNRQFSFDTIRTA